MQVKGSALRNTLAAIEKMHGQKTLAAVLAAIPDDTTRATLEGRIVPAGWYPIESSGALHVAIRDVIGRGQWSSSFEVSLEGAKLDFTGVYRVLLRSIQYDTIWDRMERAWPQYFSAGAARWIDRTPGSATAEVTGVSGFNRGIWETVAGRTQALLLLSGAKGASVEVVDFSESWARVSAIWVP
jgi:hypothetical protein